MREIKFRAWDKEIKEMVYDEIEFELRIIGYYNDSVSHNSCSQKCEKPCKEEEHFIGYLSDCPAWVVMQYTGLKDSNGKEIYEGDITEEMSWIGWCENCKSFELFLVIYGCSACEGDVLWREIVEDKSLEVIGNIYENKELLNER